MPRTMWRGAISFGLVTIPIRVFPSTEDKDVRFHQLHEKDHGRIKYKRVCAKDGEEVPYEDIVRGYEYEKNKYVVLTDDDLDAVPVESSRTVDVVQFVDLAEIDPIYYQKSYYLVPEETGVKAYHLMLQALEDEQKVGIGKVAFRDKEHLAAIRPKDGMLVLETMFWPDEIRQADFDELDRRPKVRDQEIKMARTLINNLTDTWDPAAFKDEYREALLEVIEKKIEGKEVEVIEPPERSAVVDLMDALKKSVEQSKKDERRTKTPAKKRKKAS